MRRERYGKKAVACLLGVVATFGVCSCGKEKDPWEGYQSLDTLACAQKVVEQFAKVNGASLTFALQKDGETNACEGKITVYRDGTDYDVFACVSAFSGDMAVNVESKAYVLDGATYRYNANQDAYFIGESAAQEGDLSARVQEALGLVTEEDGIFATVEAFLGQYETYAAEGGETKLKKFFDKHGTKTTDSVSVDKAFAFPVKIAGVTCEGEAKVSSLTTLEAGLVSMEAAVEFEKGSAVGFTNGTFALKDFRADSTAIALPDGAMVIYDLWNEDFTPTFADGATDGRVVFSRRAEEDGHFAYTAQVRLVAEGTERIYELSAAVKDEVFSTLLMSVEGYYDNGIKVTDEELAAFFPEPIEVRFDHEAETVDLRALPIPARRYAKDFKEVKFTGVFAQDVQGMVEFTVVEETDFRWYEAYVEMNVDGRTVKYRAVAETADVKPESLAFTVLSCENNGNLLHVIELAKLFEKGWSVAFDYENKRADMTALAIPAAKRAEKIEIAFTVATDKKQGISSGTGTLVAEYRNEQWYYAVKATVRLGSDICIYEMSGNDSGKEASIVLIVDSCVEVNENGKVLTGTEYAERAVKYTIGKEVIFTLSEGVMTFSKFALAPSNWSGFF